MASVGSVQSSTASILVANDQSSAVAIALLKKANEADKNLVNTLLPAQPESTTGLNIRA